MDKLLEKIENVKYVAIVIPKRFDFDLFGCGSAFYTYLLTLHKKVSFVCESEMPTNNYAFMPWSDKLRKVLPTSAELKIYIGFKNLDGFNDGFYINDTISTSKLMFDFYTQNGIKINKKMATALYAGLLESYDSFTSNVDGMLFARIKSLIEAGADSELCRKNVVNYVAYSQFRLKSIAFAKMQLLLDARVAFVVLDDDDFLASGVKMLDENYILKEFLFLPTVEVVVIVKEDIDLGFSIFLKSDLFDTNLVASKFKNIKDIKRTELKSLVLKLLKEDISFV